MSASAASRDLDAIVVGAGLAGLCAARRLVDHGRSVVVVDKGRGVGGRLATRRLAGPPSGSEPGPVAAVDHGAQFFTVRRPEFAALIEGWPVQIWHHGPARATSVVDTTNVRPGEDGHPRFIGTGGMTAIAKHLAADLDVRTGVRVTTVQRRDGRWVVCGEDGLALPAKAVIVTAPVPQARDLVEVPLPLDITALAYDPTLALLATLDGPAGLPDPGAVQFDDGPVHFLADNQLKFAPSTRQRTTGLGGAAPTQPAITVHASAEWSRTMFDESDQRIAEELRALVQPWLGGRILDAQVKRWRYATPTNPHVERAVHVGDGLVLAGDAFGGPKVEGAALSGLAAAALLLT